MKYINYKSLLSTVFISLINTVQLIASRRPPAPKGSGGFDTGDNGDGYVGGPIDDYLPLLFFMAILLGVWVINKYDRSELT